MPIGFQKELNTKRYEINRDTNFYISPDGDDTKGGLTPDAALKTIDGLISTVVGQYTFTKGAKAYAVFAPGEYELPVQDFPILIANPIQTRDGLLFVDHQVVYDLNQFKSLRQELVDNDARQHRQISDNLRKITAAENKIQKLVETQVDPETVVTQTALNEAVIALNNESHQAQNTLTTRIDQLVDHVKNVTEKLTAVAAEKETLQKEVRDLRDEVKESFKGFHNRYETKEDFSTAKEELAAENKALKERINELEAQKNPDKIDAVWKSLAKVHDQITEIKIAAETNHTIALEEIRGASEMAGVHLNMHLQDCSNPHKVRSDQIEFCPELSVEQAINKINDRIKPYTTKLTVEVNNGVTIKEAIEKAFKEYDIGPGGLELLLQDSTYTVDEYSFIGMGRKIHIKGTNEVTRIVPEYRGPLIKIQGPNSHYTFSNLVFDHPQITNTFEVTHAGIAVIDNCLFGSAIDFHLYGDSSGIIKINNGYTIKGGHQLYAHSYSKGGATIEVEKCQVTIDGTIQTEFFAIAKSGSTQTWLGATITGEIIAKQTQIFEDGGTIQGKQNITASF